MPRLQDERRHSGVVVHDGGSDGALGKLDSSALLFSSPSSSLCVDVLGNQDGASGCCWARGKGKGAAAQSVEQRSGTQGKRA
jgi:hypothetical protein